MTNAEAEPKPLMTAKQVSIRLSVPEQTLDKWRSTRRVKGLPHVRVGGAVRYRAEDVESFIQAGVCNGPEREKS